MGKTDALTYNYMNNNVRFADLINFYLYGGRQVVRPGDLRELDARMTVLPFGKNFQSIPVQKYRDLLKYTCMRTDDKTAYLILGIENERNVSYAMPARNMLYDAEQYVNQIRASEILRRSVHSGGQPENAGKLKTNYTESGEFLEGFRKSDRLIPVVTLVINWSGKEWTGFRSLHEMFAPVDSSILSFIPDYRINLISPSEISDESLKLLNSPLRQVFSFIKHSDNTDDLIRAAREDDGFLSMDRESVEIINHITGTNIKIRKKEETINVCKAIDDILQEKDAAVKRSCALIRERDEALKLSEDIRRERDDALRKSDDIRRERDDALRKSDDIRRERDDALRKSDDIRRERDDALRKSDDIRRERDDALKDSLRNQCSILQNLMTKLSVSLDEAMDIAGIPEEKRGILAAELKK